MTLTAEQVKKLEELGFVHMKLSWHKTYRNNSYVRIDDRGLDYYIDDSWKAESDLAELRKVGLE